MSYLSTPVETRCPCGGTAKGTIAHMACDRCGFVGTATAHARYFITYRPWWQRLVVRIWTAAILILAGITIGAWLR